MLLLGVTGLGAPELVTPRSACPVVATVVDAVAELFPEFGSGVVAAMLAVAEITVPEGVAEFTFNTSENVAVALAVNEPIVQVNVPVPPTRMVLQDQPVGGVNAAPK